MKIFTRVLTLILSLALLSGLSACSNKSNNTPEQDDTIVTDTVKSGEAFHVRIDLNMTNAYLDYAKRLEESGNDAAAARVYAMLEKAVAADSINAIRKKAEENKADQTLGQFANFEKDLAFWKEASGK